MNELNEIDSSFSTLNENKFIDLILYGSDKFDDKKSLNILMCTIKFVKGSQRFDENLLYFVDINVKRTRALFVCIF